MFSKKRKKEKPLLLGWNLLPINDKGYIIFKIHHMNVLYTFF